MGHSHHSLLDALNHVPESALPELPPEAPTHDRTSAVRDPAGISDSTIVARSDSHRLPHDLGALNCVNAPTRRP